MIAIVRGAYAAPLVKGVSNPQQARLHQSCILQDWRYGKLKALWLDASEMIASFYEVLTNKT